MAIIRKWLLLLGFSSFVNVVGKFATQNPARQPKLTRFRFHHRPLPHISIHCRCVPAVHSRRRCVTLFYARCCCWRAAHNVPCSHNHRHPHESRAAHLRPPVRHVCGCCRCCHRCTSHPFLFLALLFFVTLRTGAVVTAVASSDGGSARGTQLVLGLCVLVVQVFASAVIMVTCKKVTPYATPSLPPPSMRPSCCLQLHPSPVNHRPILLMRRSRVPPSHHRRRLNPSPDHAI